MISFSTQRLFLASLVLSGANSIAHAEVDLRAAAQRGPAVASVLDMQRETPAQQLQAIFTLLDLGETDIAQTLWDDFSGHDLEAPAKAALVKQFGAARFLNLSRRETVDQMTNARDFAESCLAASAKQNSLPERLEKLIADLRNPSAEIQRAARSDLAVSGEAGATACLAALARTAGQENNETLRTQLLLTLANMRPTVEPMLIAAIADGRGQFRRDVVELTGYLHLQDAVPWLAALAAGSENDPTVISAAHAALAKMKLSAPSTAEAKAVIRSEIRRLKTQPATDTISEAAWWTWAAPKENAALGELRVAHYPEKTVHKLAIHRLATALLSLGPATPEDQLVALVYSLETKAITLGDAALKLDQVTTDQLSAALARSLKSNLIDAAISCTKLLAERADLAALSSFGGQRSPLATALNHPNHKLRFAALEAVMKIRPQRSFAGASAVPKSLWEFAVGAGAPQAIAASSVLVNANDWAGQLRSLGYEATPATTGREAMRLALNSPRLELLLLDSDIGRPRVREVIYQLRSTPQIARLPIGVLSSLHNLPRTKQMAQQDAWLLASPRPHSDDAMQSILERLAELGPGRLTSERRSEQANAALGWMADLLETGHPYDELLRDANRVSQTLYNPALTTASLRLLAVLGTANSQQLLLDFASTNTLAIETRREASNAFVKSVDRFGKLLTSEQLLRQYDRYNASETADKETQRVLGDLLDILEKQQTRKDQ